jgi:hypothetical protein
MDTHWPRHNDNNEMNAPNTFCEKYLVCVFRKKILRPFTTMLTQEPWLILKWNLSLTRDLPTDHNNQPSETNFSTGGTNRNPTRTRIKDTAINCRSQHAKRSQGSGLRNDDDNALRLTRLASKIFRWFARLIYLVYTIQSCTMFHESLETYKFKKYLHHI